jgi:anionic cell wall polymer biosynthesis LytR-Cps2A-Psr (LCP) family protein
MGLESRTQFDGQEIDHHLQTVLHVGSNGSQDTNTLILIHIFAGGKKAVGFSIPRDDLVNYPATYTVPDSGTGTGTVQVSKGKIDGAYAFAYDQYVYQNQGKQGGGTLAAGANKAGQQATVDAVMAVTGVKKIDHIVVTNLVGFYYLAGALGGGLNVCIEPAPLSAYDGSGMPAGANMTDQDPLTGTNNSNFNAYKDGYNKAEGGAQYLTLSPAQSLAYVRSRDTLPGVDIGRTHRQQAAIDYVVYYLKHQGVFSDVGKLNTLLNIAKQWVQTDSTANLPDLAASLQALTGQNMTFSTLPSTPENNVYVPAYGGGQSVNIINIPQIQQLVNSTFYPEPSTAPPSSSPSPGTAIPAPSNVTVDVYNGNPDANGLASQVSRALAAFGYKQGAVANPSTQSQTVKSGTQVFYGAGTSANAAKIAADFGTTAQVLSSLPAGHVEVLTGSGVSTVPATLATAGTETSGTQAVGAKVIAAQAVSSSPSASPSAPASGGNSGTVSVAPNAKYGIPCVY